MLKLMCFVVVLVSTSVPGAWGQNSNRMPPEMTNIGDTVNPATPAPLNSVDPVRGQMEIAAMKRENQDRQVELKRDTDKLLALATELKQHVDSTNPNILSMDVVKKAQEIEKLAKSVKDKMKGD